MAGSVIGLEEVNRNLGRWTEQKINGIFALSDRFGKGTLERYAKLNRPWKDRTTAARNGLFGGAYRKGNKIHVFIAHRVVYGKYLEKMKAGKYAIILPTIRANKTKYSELVRRYLNS